MVNNMNSKIAGVLLILAFSLAPSVCADLLVERKTISEGEFKGIAIGLPKDVVRASLLALGVTRAKSIPWQTFAITQANLEDLKRIRESTGIRVMNYQGFAIDLFFDKGAVSAIRKSVPAGGSDWFRPDESVDDVIADLRIHLLQDKGLTVLPIIKLDGTGWVALADKKAAAADLLKADAWEVSLDNEKPRGAILQLRFRDGRLVRMDYIRPRIALE